MAEKKIPLFYWSEKKFSSKEKENYGDLLSAYLVEKIGKKPVTFVHPKKQAWYKLNKINYLAVGSILHHASRNSIVWGSGIIDVKHAISKADFRAVRGPETRKYLLDQGYECPDVYGDPALLLPKFYNPEVRKKFTLGIIPHYKDFEKAKDLFMGNPEVKVIDLMTLNVEQTTLEILECERTFSSSLHGLIVSHAYNIPSVWVQFSDEIFGDGVKYRDYFLSVELEPYLPEFIDKSSDLSGLNKLFDHESALPEAETTEKLQTDLLYHCPFKEQ